MSNKTIRYLALAVLASLVIGAVGYLAYRAGVNSASTHGAASPAAASAGAGAPEGGIAAGEAATRRHMKEGIKAGDIDPANGQRILYYHDPMVPTKHFDAPAKSPFMDMMLVPVYSGAPGADSSSISVSPRVEQNLGLRTAEVTRGVQSPRLQAVGSIAWNERDQSVVQARAPGFIERLYVRATLDPVRAGQPFADLYVPEWMAAQQEFLGIKQAAGDDAALLAAARQRLLLLGMSGAQVKQLEAAGKVQPRITLTAPSTGVVAELTAKVGMAVTPGTTLARINGLSTVWALAEVPESQIAAIQKGGRVEARSPGVPGKVFSGTVQTVLPEVSAATRTLKARVQLDNPGQLLSPGMLVTMQFAGRQASPVLLVPTEAIIATGQRKVVMLSEAGGRYRPAEVETGTESAGLTEITKGLSLGQRVVVSGQFLIDSEASLKGLESRLNEAAPAPASAASGASSAAPAVASAPSPAPAASATGPAASSAASSSFPVRTASAPAGPPAGAKPATAAGPTGSDLSKTLPRHQGEGTVESIDKDGVTLAHGPIPSVKWPAMSMAFQPPAGGLPANVQRGTRVRFEFTLPEGGDPTLTSITPTTAASSTAPGAAR